MWLCFVLLISQSAHVNLFCFLICPRHSTALLVRETGGSYWASHQGNPAESDLCHHVWYQRYDTHCHSHIPSSCTTDPCWIHCQQWWMLCLLPTWNNWALASLCFDAASVFIKMKKPVAAIRDANAALEVMTMFPFFVHCFSLSCSCRSRRRFFDYIDGCDWLRIHNACIYSDL
jgi:hypothetical protein